MRPVRAAVAAGLTAALLLTLAGCSSGSKSSPAATTATPAATATTKPNDPTALATDAYVWGYPLVVSARTFNKLGRLVGVNHLYNQPQLSGLTTRIIVAPNQDTLYSIATVDLRHGPMVLTVPDVTDRYWTYQMLDSWTNAFAYIGTRATGGKGGTFVITPPGWKGTLPAGAKQISSPTDQMFVLGRFLVSGRQDIPNVEAITRHITFAPLDASAPPPPALPAPTGSPQQVASAGIRFFDELGDALAVNPPTTDAERQFLATLAPLGIGPGRHPSTEVRDPAIRTALTQAIPRGEIQIKQYAARNKHLVNGWQVDASGGRYGQNYLHRAAVAKVGWGANVPEEAVYPRSIVDGDGRSYDGSTTRYRIHFVAGQLPPVDAFWSLTLYGPDGFFTANPIARYAIGDRTPGLTKNADGSLDLIVQHDAPAGKTGNWLPAPAGPFTLMLRLYLPKPSVLDGTWRPPAVLPAN
jgi:hypothetical protein